jgi:hypothetical protein
LAVDFRVLEKNNFNFIEVRRGGIMNTEKKECYLCGNNSSHEYISMGNINFDQYDCEICGKYIILCSEDYPDIKREINRYKFASYLFYKKTERQFEIRDQDEKITKKICIVTQNLKNDIKKMFDYDVISKEDVYAWYPKGLDEKSNRILPFFSWLQKYNGYSVQLELNKEECYSVCFARISGEPQDWDGEVKTVQGYLVDMNFISIDDKHQNIEIKENGRKVIEEYQKNKSKWWIS